MSNGALGLLTPMTSSGAVLIGQATQESSPKSSNQVMPTSDQGVTASELIEQKPRLWTNGNQLRISNGEINDEGASPSSSSGDGDHPMLGSDGHLASSSMEADLSISKENGVITASENGGANSGDMGTAADAEGVWSPDIEQAFQEALQIYPPCGRRKIILSDEGKMYGRNELIARYIKLRTGKTRTRKQVSSHIQVLARKKHREISSKLKDHTSKDKLQHSLQSMSSAQIVSMGAVGPKLTGLPTGIYGPPPSTLWPPNTGLHPTLSDMSDMKGAFGPLVTSGIQYSRSAGGLTSPAAPVSSYPQLPFNSAAMAAIAGSPAAAAALAATASPAYEGRSVCTPNLRLCEFSAYVESEVGPKNRHELVGINSNDLSHADPLLETIIISEIMDKFPSGREGLKDLFEKGPKNAFFLVKFWADISFNIGPDEASAFYAVDSKYESANSMTISVSTKVCSFGKQVVEKVETEFAMYDQGRFVYRINRSPMCEYMVKFIHQLKRLPEAYMMNSVLENFTILQVVTNKDTRETLLCVAFAFEISQEQDGSQYHIYRLIPGPK